MRSIAKPLICAGALIAGAAGAQESDQCKALKDQFEQTCGGTPVYNNRSAAIMGTTCGFALIAIQQCEHQHRSASDDGDSSANGPREDNNDD